MDTKTVELEAVIRSYFAALNGKDLEQLVNLFTADAAIMLAEDKIVMGRDAFRAKCAAIFANLSFGRNLFIDEVRADGDLGFVRSHSTGTVTPVATGKAIDELGRELFVLERESDTWRIRCYMMGHVKE